MYWTEAVFRSKIIIKCNKSIVFFRKIYICELLVIVFKNVKFCIVIKFPENEVTDIPC